MSGPKDYLRERGARASDQPLLREIDELTRASTDDLCPAETLRRYRSAIESPEPRHALRDVVLREFAETEAGRNRILDDLGRLRLELRSSGQDEEVVTDVVSLLAGWSGSHRAPVRA